MKKKPTLRLGHLSARLAGTLEDGVLACSPFVREVEGGPPRRVLLRTEHPLTEGRPGKYAVITQWFLGNDVEPGYSHCLYFGESSLGLALAWDCFVQRATELINSIDKGA